MIYLHRDLWEILVPTQKNDGKPIRTRFHRVWDEKVRGISGGLTIMPVAKGQWLHQHGLYTERVIPVRILATEGEMEQIVQLTLEHYTDQKAILAYKVSDSVVLTYRKE